MDLFDVVRACFRRWYVTLPLILVAGWFAYGSYTSVKPVYYSNSVVGLAGPSTQIVWDQKALPRNGLLETGGPGFIANLVVLGLRDPEVVARVVQGGGKANYNSYLFPVAANTPALPLITIDTTQPDAESAVTTVNLAVAQVDSVLTAVQRSAGVADEMMVRAIPASPVKKPTIGVPSRTRSTIAILAAGVGIAVVLAVLVDVAVARLSSSRRSRKFLPADGTQSPQVPSQEVDNGGSPRLTRPGAAAHKP